MPVMGVASWQCSLWQTPLSSQRTECGMLWWPCQCLCIITTQNLGQRLPELLWVVPFFSNSFHPLTVLLNCELSMFALEWCEEGRMLGVSLGTSLSSFQLAARTTSGPTFSVEPRWVWPNTTMHLVDRREAIGDAAQHGLVFGEQVVGCQWRRRRATRTAVLDGLYERWMVDLLPTVNTTSSWWWDVTSWRQSACDQAVVGDDSGRINSYTGDVIIGKSGD